MADVWTHGTFTVKAGREDEFVAAWRRLARFAVDDFDLPEPPRFLRDVDRPNVFVAVGPWRDVETLVRFREAIAPDAAGVDELVESGETLLLQEVGLDG